MPYQVALKQASGSPKNYRFMNVPKGEPDAFKTGRKYDVTRKSYASKIENTGHFTVTYIEPQTPEQAEVEAEVNGAYATLEEAEAYFTKELADIEETTLAKLKDFGGELKALGFSTKKTSKADYHAALEAFLYGDS